VAKTTLVKLIVGLYKPTVGTINLAAQTCHQIDLEKFRNRIGLVAQDTQLFAGTFGKIFYSLVLMLLMTIVLLPSKPGSQ